MQAATRRVSSPGHRCGRHLIPASALLVLVACLASARPAHADVVFGASTGYFALRAEDARDRDDVLWNNAGFLAFKVSDFNGFTFGGEAMAGVGPFLEVGGGASYYRRTVPSVYLDYVNVDGREIAQDLKLTIVPVTVTGRLFPFGREAGVQPYVGGGVAWFRWRYSEVGEFVDFANRREIFRDRFVDSGWTVGAVGVFGLRVRAGETAFVGGEFRYQAGKADLDPSQGFAGDRLDLGGYSTVVTVQFRF